MMFASGAAELTLVVLGQCTSNVLAFQLQHDLLSFGYVVSNWTYILFSYLVGRMDNHLILARDIIPETSC